MFKYSFLACFILAAFETASAVNDPKLNVSIFYETLDEPSVKFFTNNFKTNSSDLLKFINVHLVPFGRAKLTKATDGPTNVTCEHHDAECLGNRVHACASKFIPKSEDQIKFVVCTLNNLNMNFSKECVEQCFKSVNNTDLSLGSLETCVQTKNDLLMDTLANETLAALGTVQVLPAIILGNETFNASLSNALVRNFHDGVCQKLVNTADVSAVCAGVLPSTHAPTTTPPTPAPGSATVNSVTYLPIALAVLAFFNLKLH